MDTNRPIQQCPVCLDALRQPAIVQAFGPETRSWPGWKFDCPHCGGFIVEQLEYHHLLGYLNAHKVPGVSTTALQAKRQRAVTAHALRRMAASGTTPVITDGMTLRIHQEDRLPTLVEQRDNLLRWLGAELEIGPVYTFS